MPLSVKDIPYYKSLKANYDPKLARKSSGDLMQYMNGEILANNYLPEVMYYCMEALASVSLRGMKMNDVESQCQLLDHNVCGSLKSVLDRMGAAHPDIAQWGLQSIRNMAWGSTDFSDVIIESNLGATVVDMVTAHPGNKEIRLVGTQALAFLAFGTVDHSYSLAATGTLECVGKTEIIKVPGIPVSLSFSCTLHTLHKLPYFLESCRSPAVVLTLPSLIISPALLIDPRRYPYWMKPPMRQPWPCAWSLSPSVWPRTATGYLTLGL